MQKGTVQRSDSRMILGAKQEAEGLRCERSVKDKPVQEINSI